MSPGLRECACEAIKTNPDVVSSCVSEPECRFAIPAVSLATFKQTLAQSCRANHTQWEKYHPNGKNIRGKHGRRVGHARPQPQQERRAAGLLPLRPRGEAPSPLRLPPRGAHAAGWGNAAGDGEEVGEARGRG